MRRRAFASLIVTFFAFAYSVPALVQLGDILLAPKTLIDRTIEARSWSDIARDNAIVATSTSSSLISTRSKRRR